MNFSGVEKEIRTGVPYEGKYKEIFNTDDARFGGTGICNSRIICAEDIEWDVREQSIAVKLAPLSLSILRFVPYTEAELEKVIAERIRKRTIIAKSAPKKKVAKTSQVDKGASEKTVAQSKQNANCESQKTTANTAKTKKATVKRASASKNKGDK
ncbi:MAG: alpha amylase C-terminal domain-containing protein [Clostridia bacterium]|nr:alpha amylase C-terminal domain-containing protein [Clostridia bacterium]